MDGAVVRMLLQSIIDGDPSQFDESERREAISWLEERIHLTPKRQGIIPPGVSAPYKKRGQRHKTSARPLGARR